MPPNSTSGAGIPQFGSGLGAPLVNNQGVPVSGTGGSGGVGGVPAIGSIGGVVGTGGMGGMGGSASIGNGAPVNPAGTGSGPSSGQQAGALGGVNGATSTSGPNTFLSDARMKHSIEELGELSNGLGWYRFSYNGSNDAFVGLMAQEVEQVDPLAIHRTDSGIMMVDYARFGLNMSKYEDWVAAGSVIPAISSM